MCASVYECVYMTTRLLHLSCLLSSYFHSTDDLNIRYVPLYKRQGKTHKLQLVAFCVPVVATETSHAVGQLTALKLLSTACTPRGTSQQMTCCVPSTTVCCKNTQ